VSQPKYAHLVSESVNYALSRIPIAHADEQTELAMDRLLVQVGFQIKSLIPGRVSVSVDPRIADDYDAILSKSQKIVGLFSELGVRRENVLVKIPATYAGILAARTLEAAPEPVHTNMTLIFSRIQALACAQARASVISPFIGRVADWHRAQLPSDYSPINPPTDALAMHPGLVLIRQIRAMYAVHGYTNTQIMAAGFRAAPEIVQLARGPRGDAPHLVTLPPSLLSALRTLPPFTRAETRQDVGATVAVREPEPVYVGDVEGAAAGYAADLASERIALDKVPEGLAKFSADTRILEDLVRAQVAKARSQGKAGKSL
jgi:transaldolase